MIAGSENLTLLRPRAGSSHFAVETIHRGGPPKILRLWRSRYRYRADLRRLLVTGPHLVKDIGLALDTAVTESEKPFWES
jgi:uncharacterized protein YjiS (DUF1127 family)